MASCGLDVAFAAAVLLESLQSCIFSTLFPSFRRAEAPGYSRVASQRREHPSPSNGDHYSSESIGPPLVGCSERSAPTTPSDYVRKALAPGARSSPWLSGRTFRASCFTTGPSPTHQICSLRAQSVCCIMPVSRCRVSYTSPRAVSTSHKFARRLGLHVVLQGLWDISTHQRQADWHQRLGDTDC